MDTTTQTDNCPLSMWTVMIYFAADNDLDEVAFQNLQLIKEAGSNHELNVIAQLDTRGIGKTIRFRLRDKRTTLNEDVLPPAKDEVNTGDPGSLIDFVTWAMKEFEAERYMLIIWGHGKGWESATDSHVLAHRATALSTDAVIINKAQNPAAEAAITTKKTSMSYNGKKEVRIFSCSSNDSNDNPESMSQISQFLPDFASNQLTLRKMLGASEQDGEDTYSNNPEYISEDFLDNKELRQALEKALETVGREKLDILAFDACLMGMAETGYEVKDHVDYLIASEDATPRDGWPYHRIFEQMLKDPQMDAEELSLMIIREYIIHHQSFASGVTLSSCDLGQSKKLQQSLHILSKKLKEKLESGDNAVHRNVLTARAAVQSFYLKGFVDLYDFCQKLGTLSENDDKTKPKEDRVKPLCDKVMQALYREKQNGQRKPAYVFEYGFDGVPLAGAHGTSIYFPTNQPPTKKYRELEFAKDTKWVEFLDVYLKDVQSLEPHSTTTPEGIGVANPSTDISGLGLPVVRIEGGRPTKIEGGRPTKMPLPHHIEIPGFSINHPCAEIKNERALETRRAIARQKIASARAKTKPKK